MAWMPAYIAVPNLFSMISMQLTNTSYYRGTYCKVHRESLSIPMVYFSSGFYLKKRMALVTGIRHRANQASLVL
jgi:hypothetical protein